MASPIRVTLAHRPKVRRKTATYVSLPKKLRKLSRVGSRTISFPSSRQIAVARKLAKGNRINSATRARTRATRVQRKTRVGTVLAIVRDHHDIFNDRRK